MLNLLSCDFGSTQEVKRCLNIKNFEVSPRKLILFGKFHLMGKGVGEILRMCLRLILTLNENTNL